MRERMRRARGTGKPLDLAVDDVPGATEARRAVASTRCGRRCDICAFAIATRAWGFCGMDWPDYLRDEAAKYRQLAEQADDPVVKNELLELASVCEEVASNIEDRLTGG